MITLIKSSLSSSGGLEKAFHAILKGFIDKGQDVRVLTNDRVKQKLFSFPVKSLPTIRWPKTLRLLAFDQRVKRELKKKPSSIVLAMDRTTSQTHMRAGNGVHAAFLEKTYQEKSKMNPYHKAILKLEREGFESPDVEKIFVNSHMVKEEILSHYQVRADKIIIIHNGAEWKLYEKPFTGWEKQKPILLKQLGLPSHLFHFLFMGHGFTRKGLNSLLKGLSLLDRKSFHLSVVGFDKNMPVFKALALQLGLERNVTFFGPRTDSIPFYQYADCLVVPSFYDPFANVTTESLAMGIPVITTKQNGGHEIIHKNNGYVIENPLCEEEMAFYLQKAILNPKTWDKSLHIRESVSHLEMNDQVNCLIKQTLCS
jgi:UDP-glucose:(heptosyl)LPS alpha-1,3-glucosyltransferase